MLFGLTAAVFLGALLLGGGARAGYAGDVAVQFAAIALLILAYLRAFRTQSVGAVIVVPLLAVVGAAIYQLVPFPASWRPAVLWELSGGELSWRPLSLMPQATWSAILSFLPPLALFIAVSQLDWRERRRLVLVFLAFAAASLLVGLLQVAQGPASPLRFYASTGPSDAAGFFANRNHFAALLYVALVLVLAWLVRVVLDLSDQRRLAMASLAGAALWSVFAIALLGGLAIASSRAGAGLAMAALLGIAVLVARAAGASAAGQSAERTRRVVGLVVVFALLLIGQLGIHRLAQRFDSDPLEDLRISLASTTWEAIGATFPWGTGLGTFVPVYANFEKTTSLFGGYANRAHNETLDLLLELGVYALVVAVVFVLWFARRLWVVWWRLKGQELPELLQRAATICILLLLAHSLVDYPLRTTALASAFAFACALLVAEPRAGRATMAPRQASARSDTPPSQARERAPAPRRPWGQTVAWPEAWDSKRSLSTNAKDRKNPEGDENQ